MIVLIRNQLTQILKEAKTKNHKIPFKSQILKSHLSQMSHRDHLTKALRKLRSAMMIMEMIVTMMINHSFYYLISKTISNLWKVLKENKLNHRNQIRTQMLKILLGNSKNLKRKRTVMKRSNLKQMTRTKKYKASKI